VDVPTTARFVILSDEETQQILQSGEDCISSECSVDDVASLVEELKMQEGILSNRLVKIMNMIAHLQHVNEKKERKTDEVRQFVKDMLRVFSHDVCIGMNVNLFFILWYDMFSNR
jgi:flagellar biosynthesis component FlhA